MISDDFFKIEREHVFLDIIEICNIFSIWNKSIPSAEEVSNYDEYIDAYAAFEAFLIANEIDYSPISIEDTKEENIELITEFIEDYNEKYIKLNEERTTKDSVEMARNKYKSKFKLGFGYEFTDGDLKRVQELLNELRDFIQESEIFDAKHKARILSRLEKLQQELHKRVSDLDRFWGLIGDAGVAIGKFGKDVKPFVERIREISDIVWRVQARAEELPSGTNMPLLSKRPNVEE